jgi:uroporphyrinogen decarboxylase
MWDEVKGEQPMAEWTSQKRFVTAMSRRAPDRVPRNLAFGLTPAKLTEFLEKVGTQDPFDYFKIDTRMISLELHGGENFRIGESTFYPMGPRQAELKARFRDYHPDLPPDSTITEFGIAHLKTQAFHFTHMLAPLDRVDTVEGLRRFPWPRFDEPWRLKRFEEGVEELHGRGLAVIGAIQMMSAMAEYMRGQEKYWPGLLEAPEYTEFLLDTITEIRCHQARETARAGADVIWTSESLGNQAGLVISAKMWRYWYKERLRRIFAAAREGRPGIPIFMFGDGNFEELVPDLIDIGVDILGPVAPEYVDPALWKERYGDRLAFWGTISTQNTLPHGTPDDVRLEVKQRMETVGRGGGLCIGPTHRIMPEVPWENLVALYEAIDEYGSYA